MPVTLPAPVRIPLAPPNAIDVAAITPPLTTSTVPACMVRVSVAPKPVPVTFNFPLLVIARVAVALLIVSESSAALALLNVAM